jgi:DNA-binding NarL/FixJ family response regulator
VVLVDDHDVYRSGLRMLLEAHGVQVVAEAATGAEGLEAALILNPDVLVTDLGLLGMSGSELARRMRDQAPVTRVLVLTDSAAEDDLVEAVLAGACGYLLKDSRPEQLLMAVAAAAAGESFLSPRVAAALLERMRSGVLRAVEEPGPEDGLTERELQVLRLLAEGRENAEIAAMLIISPQTVKNHVSSIFRKLQMHNRIQAAVYAHRRGLV